MNKKAELFKAHVDTLGENLFSIQETHNDFDTVIFCSSVDVKENYQAPMIVILDDTPYSIVRIWPALRSVTAENSSNVADFMNQMNRNFKSFKYYVNEDGDLVLDAVLPSLPAHFDANLVTDILDDACRHLEEVYPLIEGAIGHELIMPEHGETMPEE